MTTINSTTLEVDDKNIVLASGAADAAAANGSGITIDGASATFTYASTGDKWTFNKPIDVTGNIIVSGTVDGRDVAADGTKLDGIEASATADQTKSDIDALGIDAATLDGIDSSQFLRSDVSDVYDGRVLEFGNAGNGSNTSGAFLTIEGNTDANGEGSGRFFFREHNSTTAQADEYGVSFGYRGGAASVTTAMGNSWTGLSQIANGEWGMWGHDADAAGSLIMHGSRSGSSTTIDGNLEVDAGSSSTLSVRGSGTGTAKIWARGSSQATGMVMVSQDDSHGGGIEYNGDNNPVSTGAGADYIALFRVSAGTYSWTARNAHSNNDWQFRGNLTAYASDERLKENIETIPNALDKVCKLRGVTFDWKDDCEDKGFMPTMKHETGVLAQNVASIIPDAAVPAPFDDEYLTVKHEKIIPVLIEAIKELKAEIEELKNASAE